MSLYLSVDHYQHTAQTQPDSSRERVTHVADALNRLGRKLDAVRFTDEEFAQLEEMVKTNNWELFLTRKLVSS